MESDGNYTCAGYTKQRTLTWVAVQTDRHQNWRAG